MLTLLPLEMAFEIFSLLISKTISNSGYSKARYIQQLCLTSNQHLVYYLGVWLVKNVIFISNNTDALLTWASVMGP